MKRFANLMERHSIWTASLAGAGLALLLLYGTVILAAIVEPVALIAIWRANGKSCVHQ
jgi:hypothetical protein